MERKEQFELVLEVLINIQTCIDEASTYTATNGKSFNLNCHAGICWHVFVHTPDNAGICMDYLAPIFEDMGLDSLYPVEMQITDNIVEARKIHTYIPNMYSVLSDAGIIRQQLLKDLIQYIQNQIK